MEYSAGFLTLVNRKRPFVEEVTVQQARERLGQDPQAVLLDVREDHEWQSGHGARAIHLSRGLLERELEQVVPDRDRELFMYCQRGNRSILTVAAAHKLGYRRAYSIIGGYQEMLNQHWPVSREPAPKMDGPMGPEATARQRS